MDEKKSSITSLVKDEIRLDIIAKIIWRYKKKFILPVSHHPSLPSVR